MGVSDEELVERYRRSSEPDIANELLRRYSGRVVSWCWRFAEDRDAAMDLSQEVLLKAYRNLCGFRSDAKFSTWLYLIARNHCLNYVRNRAAEPLSSTAMLDVDVADNAEWNVLATLERDNEIREIRRMMAEVLDETEAKVMLLHYAEEMPLDSVTRCLGLNNASGAKAYVVSAKRKLSAAVKRWRAAQVLKGGRN